jgi:hypothetical protein
MSQYLWGDKSKNHKYVNAVCKTNTMVDNSVIDKMYSDYTIGMSMVEVGLKYGKSAGSICNLFKRRGLETRGSGKRKHSMNELFFEKIDNEQKAYILGFIFADGHVGEKVVAFKIKKNDVDILEKINAAIESKYPITGNEYLSLRFYSPKMAANLKSIGLIPRKTWNMPSHIPVEENLIKHFFRGLIDGDGSVTIFYSKKEKKHKLSISLTGGDESFLKLCDFIISQNINCNTKKIMKTKNNWGNSYMVKWHDRQALNLCEWLYKDANIYLERKYNNAKQFFGKKSNRLE